MRMIAYRWLSVYQRGLLRDLKIEMTKKVLKGEKKELKSRHEKFYEYKAQVNFSCPKTFFTKFW